MSFTKKLTLLLVLLITYAHASTYTEEFNPIKSDLKQKILRHKTNKDLIAVVKSIKTSKPFSFQKYLETMLAHKKDALGFLGANNWKNRERAEIDGVYYIAGSYTDNDGRLVQYIESHTLVNKKLKVVVLTHTNSNELLLVKDMQIKLRELSNEI
jgi:hypothetical protein